MKKKSATEAVLSQPWALYLEAVHRLLDRIEAPQILTAARIVAASLERNGVIHLFGSGHSSLLAQEVFYRAGGLVAVNPILDPRLGFELGATESTLFERSLEGAQGLVARAGFQKCDAGIVISNSGRNALPIEMAMHMKDAGMKLIALTNLEQSRAGTSAHPSGKRLFEIADAVLDNHGPPGDAAVSIPGLPHPLGPVSTVIGAVILHAVFVEAVAFQAAKGKPPATFLSANLARVTLQDLRKWTAPYEERIKPFQPGGGRKRPS